MDQETLNYMAKAMNIPVNTFINKAYESLILRKIIFSDRIRKGYSKDEAIHAVKRIMNSNYDNKKF